VPFDALSMVGVIVTSASTLCKGAAELHATDVVVPLVLDNDDDDDDAVDDIDDNDDVLAESSEDDDDDGITSSDKTLPRRGSAISASGAAGASLPRRSHSSSLHSNCG
jgi:hypothetical protein